MAGTGVWRSQLIDARCPACQDAYEKQRTKELQALARRNELVELLGGAKPYREFTFERYHVAPGNQLAYQKCKEFNPATNNLYLWGSCGVGKTHLAYAAARRCFEETLTMTIQPAGCLSRKVRMKDPVEEQAALDVFAVADVLVLDDLGFGTTTAYWCELVKEILDRRGFADRAGLIVTSAYSLGELAAKLQGDSISSRLAGLCSIIHIQGPDARLTLWQPPYNA
jgi:DNA replication protein DnaC